MAKDEYDDAVIILWRPTGPEEMALLRASNFKRWPPRLPGQAIFYPVLNEDYANKIALEWNVPASGIAYVTRFTVRKVFLDRYEVRQVGGATILEYWIPAEDLEAFNDNIVGEIELTHHYDKSGKRISGDRAGQSPWAGEGVALDRSTMSYLPHTPSFPRKRESSLSGFPTAAWIPAFAGMTGENRGSGGEYRLNAMARIGA
jgi:hypothetical protein